MTQDVPNQLGNYRLIREIGRGGFATVYLAKHLHLKHSAAVKVLTNITETELFRKEAQTILDLSHPNIVRMFDFGIEPIPFLVMEYAPYGSLRLQYAHKTVLPLGAVVSYTRQVAVALQYAHQQRIIHRDIKPENMLIGAHQGILLSDFGIAIGQSSRTRDVVGTTAYMAPEQILGKPRPASDQYALAVTVYEWLCGRVPFAGTVEEITTQHLKASPPSLRTYTPSLSPDVEAVVLRALEKEADQRFPTVLAFAKALTKAAGVAPHHQTEFITEKAAFRCRQSSRLTEAMVQQKPVRRRAVLLPLAVLGIGSIGIGALFLPKMLISPRVSTFTSSTPTPTVAWGSALTPTPTSAETPDPTATPPAREMTTPRLLYKRQGGPYCCAWSPDGKRIVAGAADAKVEVVDAATSNLQLTCLGHSSLVMSVAWSPDGTRIASGSIDKTVRVWESSSGNLLLTYRGHTDQVNSVVWSPDGTHIASGGGDKTVQIWESSSGNLLLTYRGHTGPVNSVAWEPSGTRIASGSDDKTVQVWESSSGGLLLTYRGHTDSVGKAAWVECVAWSPDGSRIASGSGDFTAQVWDATSGNQLLTYGEHNQMVKGIAWSPEGSRIASVGDDITIRIWDTAGNTQRIYRGYTDFALRAVWSPDGSRIATTGASNDIYELSIWPVQ